MNIRALYILLCFLLVTIAKGQSIKELEEKLSNANSESKPVLLNQLSEAYLANSVTKSISYAEQALTMAKLNFNVTEEAYAYVNLALGHDEQKQYKIAATNYQKAIGVFSNSNDLQMLGYLWNRLGKVYTKDAKANEAIDASLKSIKYYEQAKDKKGAANVLIEVGDIYFNQRKFEPAVANYQKALKYYEELNQPKMIVTVYSRIGSAYSNWGDYARANEYMTKALNFAKAKGLQGEDEAMQKNIETIKKNQANYKKSQPEFIQLQQQQLIEEKNKQEHEINSLLVQKVKSIEEIEQLSVENQVKEYKIKAQQDKILKKQLELRYKDKEISLLNKDKEIKSAEIKNQRNIIIFSVVSLGLAIAITIIITRSLAVTRKQKAIIQKQKAVVEKKNQDIADSIQYAQRIQQALLPRVFFKETSVANHFILNMPKDVVSGDFYWSSYTDDVIYFAVVDCTGHGVPGALMSTLANDLLDNEFFYNSKATLSENISNINKALIRKLENQNNIDTRDGMDLCLCAYNLNTKVLKFVGAKNDLYLIRNGQLQVLPSTKTSLGYDKNTEFKEEEIAIQSGDAIYLYTDGYMDQKGGSEGKKIMSKRFKQLLVDVHLMECEKQKQELVNYFEQWKGEGSQKDDVLVAGVKFV